MRRGLHGLMVGVGLAGFVLVGATAASAQESAKPVFTLDGDAAVWTLIIKADKTADFEAVLVKYKDALSKSEKPVRKEQLAGIKFFKSPTPVQGNAMYIMFVEPVVKGEEYDITRIVTEVFPSEALEVYNKYKESFFQRQVITINKLP